MGIDRGGISHPLISQHAWIKTSLNEVIINEFGAVDGKFEQRVILTAEGNDRIDVAIDLEAMVFELPQLPNELRQNIAGRIGGDGGVDDKIDLVKCQNGGGLGAVGGGVAGDGAGGNVFNYYDAIPWTAGGGCRGRLSRLTPDSVVNGRHLFQDYGGGVDHFDTAVFAVREFGGRSNSLAEEVFAAMPDVIQCGGSPPFRKPLIVGGCPGLIRVALDQDDIGRDGVEYLVKPDAVRRLDAIAVKSKMNDKGITPHLLGF